MKKPKSSVLITLIIGAVIIVLAFLYWDYKNKADSNECDLLAKSSASNLSFNLGNNNFHFGEKIEAKLNAASQKYADKLKSCCLEHQARRITQDQYMTCRGDDGERLSELKSLLGSYERVDGDDAKKALLPLIEQNITDVTGAKPKKPTPPTPQQESTKQPTTTNSDINSLIEEDTGFSTGLGLGIEETQEQKNYREFIRIQNEAQKATGFTMNPMHLGQAVRGSQNPQAVIEKLRKTKEDYFSVVLPAAERLLGTDNPQYKALKKLNDEIKFDDI